MKPTKEQDATEGNCDMNRKDAEIWNEENKANLTFLEGFDKAIVGIAKDGLEQPKIIYSKQKILNTLIKNNLSLEEAVEYYDFNILGICKKKNDPAFLE